MRGLVKSCLSLATVLLVSAGLGCGRSAPTAILAVPLPTPPPATPTLPPPPPPTATLSPTVTPLPLPSLTPTPVIASACPAPGDPPPPGRPAIFDDYPATLATYLSAGANAQGLTRLLREWGAITDEVGVVRSLDMTGDMDAEIVVALIDPAPEFDLPWPVGDVLIFRCQKGTVVPAFQGRVAAGLDLSDLSFDLLKVEDVNGTGRADVVYITSSCGAHTCWDRLYIVEWDGAGFVDRIPDLVEQPYATFTVDEGQVRVDAGGIGSVGAGYQRGYSETWAWDGRQFALAEQIVGPPTALIHYIHDGDNALAQSDYGAALVQYQAALDDAELPAGLFLEDEEQGGAIVRAYARFKRVVAYAASGDGRAAQSEYETLVTEHPEGTPGHPCTRLGQAFWNDFLANGSPRSACAAAVALAEGDPSLAERLRLYAGYANPEYEPADLCRVE